TMDAGATNRSRKEVRPVAIEARLVTRRRQPGAETQPRHRSVALTEQTQQCCNADVACIRPRVAIGRIRPHERRREYIFILEPANRSSGKLEGKAAGAVGDEPVADLDECAACACERCALV